MYLAETPNQSVKYKTLFNKLTALFLFSIIAVMGLQMAQMRSLTKPFSAFLLSPDIFACNLLCFAGLGSFIFWVRRPKVAIGCYSVIWTVLAVISYCKSRNTFEPVLFLDVFSFKEGIRAVTYTSEKARKETLEYRPHEARTAERLSKLGFRSKLGKDRKEIGKTKEGQTLYEGYADNPSGVEFKTVLTSKNAFGAVKNYLDNSIGKKNLKRIIIDNYESEHLTDESIINAVKELSKEEEYEEVARWVSIFGKNGELLDIVRKK